MKKKSTKKLTGKKLLEQAGLAIKNEFYLEASWILSSLFEKKMTRLLEKGRSSKFNGTPGIARLVVLSRKQSHVAGASAAEFPLTRELLDGIRTWKNQRNEIFRDMTVRHVSKPRLERLAMEGIRLYKELNKVVKTVNKTAT